MVDLLEDLIAEPVATSNQIPPVAPQASQAPHCVGPVFQPPPVVSGSGGPQAPQFNPTIQPPMVCGLPLDSSTAPSISFTSPIFWIPS